MFVLNVIYLCFYRIFLYRNSAFFFLSYFWSRVVRYLSSGLGCDRKQEAEHKLDMQNDTKIKKIIDINFIILTENLHRLVPHDSSIVLTSK
jgi:hypothetical protein